VRNGVLPQLIHEREDEQPDDERTEHETSPAVAPFEGACHRVGAPAHDRIQCAAGGASWVVPQVAAPSTICRTRR